MIAMTKKRRLPRDPSTGKFEVATPFTDPALQAFAVRSIRAIRDLEPIAQEMASAPGEENKNVRAAAAISAHWLATLRGSLLEALEVAPDALREAKKPVLRSLTMARLPHG